MKLHMPGQRLGRSVAPYGAWIKRKCAGRCRSFTYLSMCEKNYFFSPCVKYVFDLHRPAHPSFSGFFALFDVGRLLQKGDVIRRAIVPKRVLLRTLAVRSKIRLQWHPVLLLSHLRQYPPPICQHCALQSGDAGGNQGPPPCLHNIVMPIWHPLRILHHLD